jgi:broad specificity phosphatase PhoE
MTHFTLVRHGTTEWMEQYRLHGVTDSPLSARGLYEAHWVAERLRGEHFDAFYSSPLGRAMQTAHIIGEAVGIAPVPLDGLRELDFGWLEGGPVVFRSENGSLITRLQWMLWGLGMFLSAERPRRFQERVVEAFRFMANVHPDGRVLAVTHSATQAAFLSYTDGKEGFSGSNKYHGWKPCAITEVEMAPDGAARVITFNDRGHLEFDPRNPCRQGV